MLLHRSSVVLGGLMADPDRYRPNRFFNISLKRPKNFSVLFQTTFQRLTIFVSLSAYFPIAEGSISCYMCSSRNGTDMSCEDPFHPAMSDYKIGCMVPKEGHVGKFPANFCVKVVGTVCKFALSSLIIHRRLVFHLLTTLSR